MGDFVSLTCPSCGGKLQVSSTIDRFACAHCGSEHIIKRGDGIIYLQPVIEGLQKVQGGVDKTASELAIKRLLEEIVAIKTKRDEEVGGWYGTNYGWGGFLIFMFAMPTFFCFLLNSQSVYLIILVASTVIVAITVLSYLNKKKKKEEIRWKKYDALVASKKKELLYHQDIVSRY